MHADEPDAEPEPYRPRPQDHLVEPMFGGLGVGEPPEPPRAPAEEPPEVPGAWWRRVLARLRGRRDE